MSIITHHTALPDTAQKTDFYNLVDNATATGIVDADIASTAAIQDTKLGTIRTAGKLGGAGMTELANIPAGAGLIPGANGGVPSGCIFMWHGSIASIPSGYVLCDGTNSTPDLRNLFIVGANADVGGVAKSTVSGSAAQSGGSTAIAQANLPASPVGTTLYHMSYQSGGNTNGFRSTDVGLGNESVNSANLGSATAYVQPFYALAFIMKS